SYHSSSASKGGEAGCKSLHSVGNRWKQPIWEDHMILRYVHHARGAAVLAVAAGLLAASVSATAAQTAVKGLHLEANPEYVALWEDLVAQYEAENPDTDIQMQFLENEAFKAKLPTLLQSSDAPHFFYSWGGGVLKEQASTGALMDLTEAMNADGGAWKS